MEGEIETGIVPAARYSRWQRIGPIGTLLLLSPMIGEVMSGATRLSYIFALVPEIMVWGCGALLIREVVRRWRGIWPSVLLLGFALAIAEEFIIQQTSVAPLPWLGNAPAYGRVWGVNWPYFVFMLGYEAVWIVLVPIQITELIFSGRRQQPWLRRRGLFISGAAFLLGSFVAWFFWTQRARPLVFHVPAYHPPLSTLLGGAVSIFLLAGVAYGMRRSEPPASAAAPPRQWLVVTAALLLGLPWYALMALVFSPAPKLPLWLPLGAAGTWALAAFWLIRRWSSAALWHDVHRWALCFGALLVCMLGGFLGAGAWPTMDLVAKTVLNLIAVGCMLWLKRRIAKRASA